MGRMDGKVALISGAARGQGEAEARRFVAEGAKVMLGDVLDAEGEAVAAALGDAARYVHLDVTDPGAWDAAVAATTAAFGRLDVLVNNAGIVRFTPIDGTAQALEDYRAVIEVNQVGVYLGMGAVVPAMTDAGGGSIVNISSIDGIVGMAGVAAYVASKFAVRGMTKVAALELAPRRIRVNSVHPGFIDTPMITEDEGSLDDSALAKSVPWGRLGKVHDVTNVVLFLASDESDYCNGAEFVVDGGFIAGFSPAV